jgi:hypothetical protein
VGVGSIRRQLPQLGDVWGGGGGRRGEGEKDIENISLTGSSKDTVEESIIIS